jgi:hypothetical protein
MSARSASRREAVLALAFYAAVTVVMTWPQAARLDSASADLLDAKLSAWILHWDYVQTLRDPLDLFQAPILYPAKYVLAFSENLYGAAVFGFPLLAGGASLLANYNAMLLAGMCLSAWSAWALARYVTGDALASLVAGIVYGFLPYKISQLAHFHMQWGPFLCLVFLFLLRYLDEGRRRDALLLGVFFAWNVLACLQYAFFTGFLIAAVLVMEAMGGGPRRWERIRNALLAMGLAGLACVPFLIPYQKASALYGMRRSIGEMTFFSARPGYFLSAGDRNRIWGPLTTRWRGYEGDFFPGLVPLALAAGALAVLRGPRRDGAAPEVSPRLRLRRRLARVADGVVALLAVLWVLSLSIPNLKIGPLSLGDAGRVQVFLTLAILGRLALAFPRRSRYASLADFVRRARLDRRALLLLVVGGTGFLVSLGGHTPYYRFLFQSFGAIFRSIRVAARGVVLFQVALAVLAAWGLSLWTRGRSRGQRRAIVTGVLAALAIEYRAFPIEVYDYDAGPRPVYEWLRSVDIPGGIVELPFGFPHDCEYTLRQAEHGKPIVNGHSSFAPKGYTDLFGLLLRRPIPDHAWSAVRAQGAAVLLYHPPEANAIEAGAYRNFLRQGLETGRLELLASFGGPRDRAFAFHLSGAPPVDPRLPTDAASRARQDLDDFLAISDSAISPPFGVVQVPAEGATVAPGSWAMGWALDDSGIAEIRIGTELGAAGVAGLGAKWPGLTEAYPDFSEASRGGYGFAVPLVPPGPHVLTVTFVGRDGGLTVLKRAILVAAPTAASPTPRDPGS